MARRRLTVQEAAEELGLTVDAVRSRIKRGSIESDKGPDGRVFVKLGSDQSSAKPEPEIQGPLAPLIEAKDETIEILREQLRAEREAHGEARKIIAALTSRIPEIEAPRESTQNAEAPPEGSTPGEDQAGPEAGGEGPERRPWWRRVFGG